MQSEVMLAQVAKLGPHLNGGTYASHTMIQNVHISWRIMPNAHLGPREFGYVSYHPTWNSR